MTDTYEKSVNEMVREVLVGDRSLTPSSVLSSYNVAGVIAINTVLLTLDCSQYNGVSIQCSSIGTTGVIIPEWSNDNVTWVAGTLFTPQGVATSTISAAGLLTMAVQARYFRLRLSVATTAGTTTLTVYRLDGRPEVWYASPILGNALGRIGNVGVTGVWYDETTTTLAGTASFTGTSRDLTAASTSTTWTNAVAQEVVVSAESDVTGTLWIEASRDNTNWRRIKSVATTAVTGGGFYAEIVHRPSWRYIRVGYTNGAGAQARMTVGLIQKSI